MFNRKILIVDDEEKSRLYLANILEELHPEFYIRLAATPKEALYIVEKDTIDLVLLDVEMPGMTGLDMLKELRKTSEKIPVIIVSAYKRAEFIQTAMRLNTIDYIDKPVDPQELENALSKVFFNTDHAKTREIITHFDTNERFCLMTILGEMFVEYDEILYFETLKRYSIVFFTDGSNKIVRDNLECLAKKLPQNRFLRVSRQCIVNMKFVKLVSKSNKTLKLITPNIQIELRRIYPHVIQQVIADFKL